MRNCGGSDSLCPQSAKLRLEGFFWQAQERYASYVETTQMNWPLAGLLSRMDARSPETLNTAHDAEQTTSVQFFAFSRVQDNLGQKKVDLRGFDPRTSRMQSERTTNCSTNPSVR